MKLASEQKQKRLSMRYVILGGIVIAGFKCSAFFLTNSNAILSDVLESLINLAAGCFSLFSLYYAGKPRDALHPYGHGKIEFLAATVQGSLVFLAGAIIGIKALYNIFYPHPVQSIDSGILFVSLAAVGNFGLGMYLRNRGNKLDSLVLRSDGKRILMDAYSSAALVAGLGILYYTRLPWVDSAIAILAAVFIVRTGFQIVRHSVRGLLDAADSEILEDVVKVLQDNSRPAWIDIQNMRASDYGMYLYIDCHITMPWYWNLKEISEQVREAELLINQEFKERVELYVQAEPCRPSHCHLCRVENCSFRQQAYKGKKNWKLKEILEGEKPKKLGA